MTTTETQPEIDQTGITYPRSVVLIDADHDSSQTGPSASLTVPIGVALDDSHVLRGVSFVNAHILSLDTQTKMGVLVVTLHCTADAVEYKPGVKAPDAIKVAGIPVLSPAWNDSPVRADKDGFEVDVYAQSLLSRAPRPDEQFPNYYRRTVVDHHEAPAADSTPRH